MTNGPNREILSNGPSKLNMFWKPKTLDFVLFKEENRSTLLFLANNKIDTS